MEEGGTGGGIMVDDMVRKERVQLSNCENWMSVITTNRRKFRREDRAIFYFLFSDDLDSLSKSTTCLEN